MERASGMPSLSQVEAQVAKFRTPPRPGQMKVFESLPDCDRRLCIKLPTGYGKTYAALGTYSILKASGIVNRMLVVFPTEAQLHQFETATPRGLPNFAIDGPSPVTDIRFFGANAIKRHQLNQSQVYAITVQSLIGARGMDNVQTLMGKGRWLVVVDEYHHYGIDKPFGDAVNSLSAEFILCMSATPYRPDRDGAFGEPHVDVTYKKAVEELAVKPLRGHAYHYKIDAIDESGDIISYTTSELAEAAGGNSPEKIEKLTRKMRFSPKYISPLITNPIDRMIRDSMDGRPRQAIIGCMSVSHALLVCQQVKSTFPNLRVDWVGTGEHGRDNATNKEVISSFAPSNGEPHTLDVLVHVGMAGEGLDTIHVSEVVHLNAASVSNGNNQENGRAARYVPGVTGHINFDGCSEYAKNGYIGTAIMDAMDDDPPNPDAIDKEAEDRQRDEDEWLDLPERPDPYIYDLSLEKIDSGDQTVQLTCEALAKGTQFPFTKKDFEDPNGEATAVAISIVKQMRKLESAPMNEKSEIALLKENIDKAVSTLAGNIIRMMKRRGARIEKSLAGDIRRRVNSRKKRDLGAVANDADLLANHYDWVKRLEVHIKSTSEIPSWLT